MVKERNKNTQRCHWKKDKKKYIKERSILTTDFCWPPDCTDVVVMQECQFFSTSWLIILIHLYINKMSADCYFIVF